MSIASRESFLLTGETVDIISEKIQDYCRSLEMDKKDITRNRLVAEECLLDWMDEVNRDGLADDDPEKQVVYVTGKAFGKHFFRLEKKGVSLKPGGDSEDGGTFSNSILVGMDLKPEYSYRNKTRHLTFRISKRKRNPLIAIGQVLLAAVIVGVLLKLALPAGVNQGLLDGFLTPIYDTLFRLLSTISGPLILLSIMWGVYGIGDTTMLGQIGKKMILRFMRVICIVALVVMFTFPIFGNILVSASTGTSQLATIFKMILDIVPSNIVEPFLNGNTLQIIFVAFVVGIAMLFLGKKVDAVAQIIEQINYIVQFLMDLIGKLIPFFIFIIVVRMILSGTISVLKSLWLFAIMLILGFIVLSIFMTVYTGIKFKASPVALFRKNLPTFLIALTTASSAAAFGSNVETCERKFGIDSALTSFGIPLGMVLMKPGSVIYFLMMSYFFCGFYGVECSPSWIIMAVIVSTLLSFATPPIPGGGAVAYTVLFTQLGIPMDALAIALSIDILTDFPITATNIYNLPFVLTHVADNVGMLDENVLRK